MRSISAQFDAGWSTITSDLKSDTAVFVITDATCSGGEAKHIRERLLKHDRPENCAIVIPLCKREAIERLEEKVDNQAEMLSGLVLDEFKRQWKDIEGRDSYKTLRGDG